MQPYKISTVAFDLQITMMSKPYVGAGSRARGGDLFGEQGGVWGFSAQGGVQKFSPGGGGTPSKKPLILRFFRKNRKFWPKNRKFSLKTPKNGQIRGKIKKICDFSSKIRKFCDFSFKILNICDFSAPAAPKGGGRGQ
jgi:hypothetical protein